MLYQIIGLFLLITFTVAADLIPDDAQADFIDKLNEHRRATALQLKFQDMHKLTYDKGLADIAQEMTRFNKNKLESKKGFGKTWRYMKISDYENGLNTLKMLFRNRQLESFQHDKEYIALEPLVPLQEKIGCVKNGNIICVIGPQGTQKSWFDSENNKNKKCLPEYKIANGLCTPNDEIDQLMFIAQVNDLRQAAAWDYGIPNMHKLVFSRKLAQMVNQLLEDNQPTGVFKSWRYTAFQEYSRGAKDLSTDFSLFIEKSDVEQSNETSKEYKEYIRPLEHLIPLQTHIGCAEKPSTKRYNIICFLGPEGSLNSWSKRQNGVAGSNCSPGYMNVDGLCTAEDARIREQLLFIAELNKYRHDFAQNFSKPNMHKLVFSNMYSQIAQGEIDGRSASISLEKISRFTGIHDYRGGAQDLQKRLTDFLKKDKAGRKKEEEVAKKDGYFESLEHVVPLQKKIGCAENMHSRVNYYKILCYFGPEGELNIPPGSEKGPGSDCSVDYSNVDGLCVPNYEIAVKNDVKTTEQPEITIEKNNLEEASTVPIQDSVTTETDNTGNLAPKTIPPGGNSNGIPPITPSKITSAPFARPTTTESELDRLIAKYQREEQDGDLPSEEDEEEHEFSNSGSYYALISIILIMFGVLFE